MSAKLSPSRYEAYLQIYKSPHKAIDTASRFQALRRKAKRTKAEEAEFQKLKRIDLTPDGLRVICVGLDKDPEKIGIHMMEMPARFRNEGIAE